jgi:hypothetical protein
MKIGAWPHWAPPYENTLGLEHQNGALHGRDADGCDACRPARASSLMRAFSASFASLWSGGTTLVRWGFLSVTESMPA